MVFYTTLGPMSFRQETGYGLLFCAKVLMLGSTVGACLVIYYDLPDLPVGGVVSLRLRVFTNYDAASPPS
jgi:hypothetical protein